MRKSIVMAIAVVVGLLASARADVHIGKFYQYDDNGAIYERLQRVYFTVAAGTVGAYVRLMTGPEAYYT